MIKLGYSLGESKAQYTLSQRIDILLALEQDAVEISYVAADRLKEKLQEKDVQAIQQFDYISIHAPALLFAEPKTWIRYPSEKGERAIQSVIEIADAVHADTILFHPDSVDDFKWIHNRVGSRLAFENMDVQKKFGKTIADLEKVFALAPKAKWVCDVNHIYTLDRTMKVSGEFHKHFGDRLCHYHVSGYGGWHDALHISQEDVILEGILDRAKPIIDEGRALRNGCESLEKEHQYILERMK